MQIAVFGNFGVQNFGDDLILKAHILKAKKEGAKLVIFCGDPEEVKKKFRVKAYPFFPSGLRSFVRFLKDPAYRNSIRQGYKALQESDRIELGGGGLLVDRRLKSVLLWYLQLRKIASTKRPFRFVANSFELRHRVSRRFFLPFLQQADSITVRDSSSRDFIQSYGIPAELTSDLSELVPLRIKRPETPEKMIAISLCRWGLKSHHLDALKRFIQHKKTEGYLIRGLACQTHIDDDRKILLKLDPEIQIDSEYQDILKTIASAKALISMRLHALIVAQRLKTPAIAIAYQQKVKAFYEDQGLQDLLIPMKQLRFDQLQSHFDHLC